ncbi:Putative GTP cyclohydrolase 1 type 2 [Aquisphaera giovannonii]|uniref:GTP cyclohydrolase 1 type 2 homolog n=1 Tax=Aquisphaera giovannonii TaxID=406548 RepID=A0A5B9VWZ3_9BACT|nr:Nif3-like dinuclear metal center hexameric protein [Aquisphaera giovannonii]QEH32629.1 Putative GTP cyclohydrolase 1 type 2 [Aquisphaera giovannonii]
MKTVSEVAAWLEGFAPSRLAESWDNVGLLMGDPDGPAGRVMTCLTVTDETAGEAVEERADLVVSHHPVLFRGEKRIRADLPGTSPVWKLAKAGIAVASPHTAFDSTAGGINDGLCRRFGLVEVAPIRPAAGPATFKVVAFTPASDRDAVLAAAFAAGAGRIGAYEECSFAIPGQGTFFGTEGTDPAVGRKGRRETVEELRLEMICPGARLAATLAAIRSHHSYEEPAIDVYPLHDERPHGGSGRIGRLEEVRGLEDFAAAVSRALGHIPVHVAGDPAKLVRRVAVACGAADEFLGDAARAGADVLVTGEARFHRAIEAEALGMGLILAGHYGTERPAVEDLAVQLALAFPELIVWPSRRERDPLRLVQTR